MIGILILCLLLSPLFLIASPYFAWRLRTPERLDPEIVIRSGREHISRLSVVTPDTRENSKLQYWSLIDMPIYYFLNPKDTRILDFLMQSL